MFTAKVVRKIKKSVVDLIDNESEANTSSQPKVTVKTDKFIIFFLYSTYTTG